MATPIPENRARFELADVVAATGGRLVELESSQSVVGVSTDTRTLPAGALFVALGGPSYDGHAFVAQARERGAVPLVAAAAGLAGSRIEVEDPLLALAALARAHVDRVFATSGARPVLAIGGAAGKTTTKTLATAAVGALLGDTLFTPGNINNRIGVPMTLLTLSDRHRAAVIECGTSERGEIAALAAVTRHDVGLVTNVGIEHSLGLGSLAEIADEEAGLLVTARRAAVTHADDPLLVYRLAAAPAPRKLTFGLAESADLRLVRREVVATGVSELHLVASPSLLESERGREFVVSTPLLGPAAAMNVLAALAGALALLDRPVAEDELERAAGALGSVEAVAGRMRPLAVAGALVLDDTYNSNPKSLAAALETATEMAEQPRGGLVLALGDMLELGALAAAEHDAMVRAADASGARELLLVGAESCAAAARVQPTTPMALFPDSEAAAPELAARLRPGDVALVKGSRGTRMERLLEALPAGISATTTNTTEEAR